MGRTKGRIGLLRIINERALKQIWQAKNYRKEKKGRPRKTRHGVMEETIR